MVLEEGQPSAEATGDRLLPLVEVGEEMHENVGDGHATGDREPDAPRRPFQEPQLAGGEMHQGERDGGDERGGYHHGPTASGALDGVAVHRPTARTTVRGTRTCGGAMGGTAASALTGLPACFGLMRGEEGLVARMARFA